MNKNKKQGKKIQFVIIVGFCLFIFIGNFLLAGSGPKIKLKENSWDFGRVKQGKILTHIFIFNNTGNAPLVIKKVRTSCGCTAALVSEKEIAPGGKGEIKVRFDTRGYEGEVKKYVYVETNDSQQPRVQLTVSARIDVPPRPRIDLDRYSLDLGLLLESEEMKIRITIRNKGELELVVNCFHKDASFYQKGEKINFPLKIAAGKQAEVEIRIRPRKRRGLIREYVLIKSNDPYRGTLSIYVSGYVITKSQLKELFKKYKDILK